MKNSKIFTIISLILVIFMFDIILNYSQTFAVAEEIDHSEIVMERSSKRVLKKYGENKIREMASTTKIATAITVINNCNLNDVVTITEEMTNIEGSSIYLKADEKLKVIDLLYGLMLRSGNDSACALAIHCSKSIDKFAELMNKTAKEFGCKNTNFTNPHGLHDENHYTTCYDLALITCNALDNDIFSKIVATKKYECTNSDGFTRIFYNKNKLLSSFEGCDGVKTGYTKHAGRCLVSSATKNGMQLVCVVLNCAPMFERSSELLSDCFSAYNLKKIVSVNQEFGEIEVKSDFLSDNLKLKFSVKNDVYVPITESEYKNFKCEFEIPEFINFPVKNNTFIGKMNVLDGNNLICSEKLYIINGKENYDYGESFQGVVSRWKIYENKQIFG